MRTLRLSLVVIIMSLAAYASVTGPQAGFTDAPGDIANCVNCHDTFERANVGPGAVRIDGAPKVYEPAQQYTLAITVQQPGFVRRFGFQLTSIDENGNRAGGLEPLGSDVQLNLRTGPGDRQYIQHTEAGASSTTPNQKTWQVRWTAPAADQGSVRFFVAGNAADGDGTNQGDFIYTSRTSAESASTVVSLTLESGLDGLALEPGSHQTLSWIATNPTRIESTEVRYSNDDGRTFPITHLIVSTGDSTVHSIDWTVPNDLTPQARIRVQAVTKSGASVEVTSGRFRIGIGPPPPEITAVRVEGKHLFVSGNRFENGAVVQVNGQDVRTVNLDDASHELKCKKVGKQIAPGSTVSIVVRNPDQISSAAFTFTRPN